MNAAEYNNIKHLFLLF